MVAVPVIARVVPVAFVKSNVPVIVVSPAIVTVSSCPMSSVEVPYTNEPLES